MNDPAIGSSSPHWACIMSAGRIPKSTFEYHENNGRSQGSTGLELPTKTLNHSDAIGNNGGGQQMSPYAPVFYPMGSYAAQLLAQEQAAQLNSGTMTQRNGDSQPYSIPNNGSGSGQCNNQMGMQRSPHNQQQQKQQTTTTYPSGGENAIGTFEGNCNSFGLGMTMKTNGGGSSNRAYRPYTVSNLNSSEPNWREQQSGGLASLSTSLPINGLQGTGHGVEVPVPPRTMDMITTGPLTPVTTEWTPYSYATKPVISRKVSTGPLCGSGNSSLSNNNVYPNNSSSSNSCADQNLNSNGVEIEFPSFDEFARQLDNCDISRNEFLATLRNLMIRANDMMMPLLRGPFSHMTPVQMAAYTTAILNTPPLHPSLFMSPDNRRFLSSNNWNLPPYHPHSLTPQDLAKINPRPVLINAATQTEYFRNFEMPMNATWMTTANPTDGIMGAGQMPPQAPPPPAQFGFWGRSRVPMHPHPHPHAHPHQVQHAHSHQMAHPMTGALRFPETSGNNTSTGGSGGGVGGGGGGGTRYGFRIGHYATMPCRYGPMPSGRHAKHNQSSDHYGNNKNSYTNGIGPGYSPRGQRTSGTSYPATASPTAGARATADMSTVASASIVTNSDDNTSTDLSISFLIEHNHQKQARGPKKLNSSNSGNNSGSNNNGKNNKNNNYKSNNNTSSSSNISSSSSNCFPMLGVQHSHRRRRSTTTECSSEDPEEVLRQERIRKEEIDRKRQIKMKFVNTDQENRDRNVCATGPTSSICIENRRPEGTENGQLNRNGAASQVIGNRNGFQGAVLTTHAQNRQFHATPTTMMVGDSHVNTSISNIFMRPTGPMMPMLHERSPLPPILFDVNTNIASATVVMPPPHAANMMSHHHIMNAMGMPPLMAMFNPNMMPPTINTIRNMNNNINLNANPNVNVNAMANSNGYLSEFDGLNNTTAAPTIIISDISSNQQNNIQNDVTEEFNNSGPSTHQPSYASLLQ